MPPDLRQDPAGGATENSVSQASFTLSGAFENQPTLRNTYIEGDYYSGFKQTEVP